MHIIWGPDFETGNEIVDGQHQYFIDLINQIGSMEDAQKQRELIADLEQYASYHFSSEIQVAEALGLPAAGHHHQRHLELLDQLYHTIARFDSEHISKDDLLRFLVEWFAGHTFREDKKLFNGESA